MAEALQGEALLGLNTCPQSPANEGWQLPGGERLVGAEACRVRWVQAPHAARGRRSDSPGTSCLAQAHHQGKLADSLKETISLLETADDLHPSIASEFLGGLETYRRWSQRTQQAPDTVIDNNTIGHHVARWLENMRARAQLGQISPERYDNVRDQIARFENFVGTELPVAAINEDVYEKYFLDLAGWARSPVTADGHLRVVKQFLHYLYGKRLIELPRSLKARQLRFQADGKGNPGVQCRAS